MKPIIPSAVCTAMILLAACAGHETCHGQCAEGIVLDATTGKPVPAAEVCLSSRTGQRECVRSDETGHYTSGAPGTELTLMGHGSPHVACPSNAEISAPGYSSQAISLSPGCFWPGGGYPRNRLATASLTPGGTPLSFADLAQGRIILVSRAASESEDDARGIDYEEFIQATRIPERIPTTTGFVRPAVHLQVPSEVFELAHVGQRANYRAPRHRVLVSYARTCDGIRKTRAVAATLGAAIYTAAPSGFQGFDQWEELAACP